MRRVRNTLMMGALMLAGCVAGPDYQPPEEVVPPAFVLQDVLAALNEGKEEEDALPLAWWEGFHDPLLNELVETGLEKNLTVAAAAARLRTAQAGVDLAAAGDAPEISAELDGSVQEQRGRGADEDASTTRRLFGALAAAWTIDLAGGVQRREEAALAAQEAAQEELKSALLGVSSDIARVYVRLRGNQRRLELLRQSVALQEKTLSIVQSRFDSGLAPELDVQRARTSVENLRAGIPPLEQELQTARHRLAVLAGAFPGVYEEKLAAVAALPDYHHPAPKQTPLAVLAVRPDIRRAEAELKEAVAGVGVAEADYYPALRLTGRLAAGATGVSGAHPVEVVTAALGALIEQALLDGGARDARLEAAKARADEALALYRQALREGMEEVETALAAIDSSLRRRESLEKAVEASARGFAQAETLYQQGLISFLDVVDAQRVLAGAEQSLADERTNYAVQIAGLFEALGAPVEKESGIGPGEARAAFGEGAHDAAQ